MIIEIIYDRISKIVNDLLILLARPLINIPTIISRAPLDKAI